MVFIQRLREDRANAKAVAAETAQHHVYGLELIADGFVSPIVLASDRLTELQGDMDLQHFSNFTGLSEFELAFLLENTHLEPTCKQVMTISHKTGRSIMWLLGYHVPEMSRLGNGDNDIMIALSKRNSAEDTLKKIPVKGILNGLMRSNATKRVEEANRAVAFTAAQIVARLHQPLSNRDLMWMKGQPVYIEYTNQPTENGLWGLSVGTAILTERGRLALTGNGETFSVYQTPKF